MFIFHTLHNLNFFLGGPMRFSPIVIQIHNIRLIANLLLLLIKSFGLVLKIFGFNKNEL